MKKIISILVCVCVLLSAMVFTASAADGVTISFAPDENRISYSSSQQVWQENGITVTNNKGASTTALRDKLTDDHIRCYKSSEVIIEYPGMKTIVIDSVTYDDNDYAAPWTNSFDASLGTATANDGDVTITLNSAVDSLTFASMSGQGRAYSITVYTGDAPATPPTEGEDDTTTSTATLVDTPVAGTAYKFGMIQENKSATDVYYLAGGMAQTYYLATTTDVSAAIDVYLEETTGGYYLYAMVNGTKSYINMVVSGTHVNGAYEATASTVYTYDAASKTVIATVNDAPYWFGTRNDKTYTTVGPCATEFNGFYCKFYTLSTGEVTPPTGGGEVTPPAEEEKPVELPKPDATNTLSIKEAIELGAAQDTSAYTTDKYYVTGKVTAVTSDMYGNMYLADEEGNEILVYGTYGADGKDRYDALAAKPDEGDTVTVYGVVGNYNGTPQLKNAWIIEFTAGELDVEEPTEPEADSVLTIEEAIALGLTKRSNTFTENKYYVTGVITEIYNEEYGNMRITDDAGNILTLYGTWEVLDEIRFDAMENKPAVGDTITVYGVIGQYNGTPQMKNGVFTTAPTTDDDNDDTTTGDNTTGGTTGGNANTDNSTTSPSTGDNVGAIVAMAVAAAAVLVASKKR